MKEGERGKSKRKPQMLEIFKWKEYFVKKILKTKLEKKQEKQEREKKQTKNERKKEIPRLGNQKEKLRSRGKFEQKQTNRKICIKFWFEIKFLSKKKKQKRFYLKER